VHRPQLYTTTVDGAGRPDCHVNGMGRRGALLTCADRPFIALGQTLKAIARPSLPRRAPRLASHWRASLPMPRTCSTPLKGAMHRPRCRPLHFRRKSGAGSWRRLCRVCSPEVEARGRWMHSTCAPPMNRGMSQLPRLVMDGRGPPPGHLLKAAVGVPKSPATASVYLRPTERENSK
jgi:hypothetical protein